jgi:hypothetical protein
MSATDELRAEAAAKRQRAEEARRDFEVLVREAAALEELANRIAAADELLGLAEIATALGLSYDAARVRVARLGVGRMIAGRVWVPRRWLDQQFDARMCRRHARRTEQFTG